jgi:hypothetical protein
MSALSDHAENLLLDWLMTNGAASRPTTWYVALFTAAPNDAGGGTEVSTGGYARQSATFTVTGDTASNSNLIEYTAGGASFGTVTHIGVFDALTTGNLLWHGAMTASKLVEDGDKLEFSVGNIDLTLA